MSQLGYHILRLINDDRLIVAVTSTTSLAAFCYIYWSYWIAPWSGTLILLSLCIYSLYTADRKINTHAAKLCRAMTGILIILFICAVCYILCYPRRWESKRPWHLKYRSFAVLTISLVVVYKISKVFLNRITCGGLILAGMLDSVLILFLITRPNLGPLGPGLGRDNF